MKSWVLGGGKQEVGRSYLIGPVILGETGAQVSSLRGRMGRCTWQVECGRQSQVSSVMSWAWDMGAWRDMLSSTTGMGLRDCDSHFIPTQDESSPKPQK